MAVNGGSQVTQTCLCGWLVRFVHYIHAKYYCTIIMSCTDTSALYREYGYYVCPGCITACERTTGPHEVAKSWVTP